jgi:hypothetical protein
LETENQILQSRIQEHQKRSVLISNTPALSVPSSRKVTPTNPDEEDDPFADHILFPSTELVQPSTCSTLNKDELLPIKTHATLAEALTDVNKWALSRE